jgi:hypothetical protein
MQNLTSIAQFDFTKSDNQTPEWTSGGPIFSSSLRELKEDIEIATRLGNGQDSTARHLQGFGCAAQQ